MQLQTATNTSYPLSPMQQGMLFNNLFAPGSGVDTEQMVWGLQESVDVTAFLEAWKTVVARHAILRTSFDWENHSNPVQVVHENITVPFEQVDIQGRSQEEQEQEIQDFLKADRAKGFDFKRAPLMRLTLFQLDEASFKLVWTFSHAMLDGRSFTLLIKEVFAHYEAKLRNESLDLGTPPRYQDYIEWLQQEDWSQAKEYWKKELQGFTAPTPLVVDNAASTEQNGNHPGHGREELLLTEEQTAALKQFALDNNLTLNSLVQGAWALLLNAYSGEQDLVFGATRAGRHVPVEEAGSIMGVFINTLPVRVRVDTEADVLSLLKQVRATWVDMRPYEHMSLSEIQGLSDIEGKGSLFESIIVFENYALEAHLQSVADSWQQRTFDLYEQTNFPLNLYGYGDKKLLLRLEFDDSRFDQGTIERMLGHLHTILEGILHNPGQRIADVRLLTSEEEQLLLQTWNKTDQEFPGELCVHQLFEKQVASTPDALAVAYRDDQLTYSELNARANQLAHHLKRLGVQPDTFVGICTDRSLEMMVSILAVLKSGGAYVPLDPDFPKDRLTFMVEDANIPIVITQDRFMGLIPSFTGQTVCVDTDWQEIAEEPKTDVESGVTPNHLSYVIYTSGSTGKPKGVMVEHRNVVNFFTGMDDCIKHDPPGVWLAVTSLSFDISVLELFWTIARGFNVVLYDPANERVTSSTNGQYQHAATPIDVSLFYFASDEGGEGAADKYRLLLEGAKYADENGFKAVWTPERHFHAFGGLYPNPSVTSAAIASVTKQIRLRAGSCVSPLHSPIRIAEEWSVVDNISQGRVGISFAAGWQPNDFVLMPDNFQDRKQLMFTQIEEVKRLWKGDTVEYKNGVGTPFEVRTLPRPIQKDLPVWITAAGSPETFRLAGANGYNILTHLLGQSVEELTDKVNVYRKAREENGFDPDTGIVTLMLHTYVGESDDEVRELVREPMKAYLKSSVGLVKLAAEVPIFKQKMTGASVSSTLDSFSEEELEEVLDFSFERYFETSGLFGTVETCLKMVDRVKGIGVTEIACLIDFGGDTDVVMAQMPLLNEVRKRSNTPELTPGETTLDESIAGLIRHHGVTHLQCTPSMASLFAADPTTLESLKELDCMMVGGEAFPPALASQLEQAVRGDLVNMYGPTETTIWSSTYTLQGEDGMVPIGRPIANTQLYILDKQRRQQPVGVPGELLIGGDGVTRGYLNRPELTEDRFVEQQIYSVDAGRLYRTGDMVRYLPDGNIEFMGRFDHQVKIRGYRIELGEIEKLLEEAPGVRSAVTIVREDVPGDQRIVAYVILEEESTVASSTLESSLRKQLPPYMVPSHIVLLEEFPLTPNKKVDRKALPVPDAEKKESSVTFVSPENELERQLAEIWKSVLNISQVGIDDNFFDMGGHSLMAVQVHKQVQDISSRQIAITDLFRFPTVRSLARFMGLDEEEESERVSKSRERASSRREAMGRRKKRARTLR